MNTMVAQGDPSRVVIDYVTQTVHLRFFMSAHLHQLLRQLPRSDRHLTKALYRAIRALTCRFDGSYPSGC